MSRTDNTMPWRIQAEDGRVGFGHCVPPGGFYKRIGRNYVRYWWRGHRRRVHMQLHAGIEPAPEQHRHSEKWMYW
jgi:hypothetical protein